MDPTDKDCLIQVDNLLASNNQTWLFGAGISRGGNVPLMSPLTNRVFAMAQDQDPTIRIVLDWVKAELPDDAHIEHILSHLGDLAALAERSKEKKANVGTHSLELEELRRLHLKVLQWISETIRWGYIENPGGTPNIGSRENPIVNPLEHINFISALFKCNQAGVADRRRAVRLFTTNYDTLLEDALALECLPYWDGFSGGAVAFRNHRYGQKEPEAGFRAHVIKLHGSIDWRLSNEDMIWRVRDGDTYLPSSTQVLIYPQSTKYLATQRDPFAAQFDLFRRALNSPAENVLAICGYSFGDDHINQEIELALRHPDNNTTILAFSSPISETLKAWQNAPWSKRLYIISDLGIYVGSEGPSFPPPSRKIQDWWTFQGVANILSNGAEACIL